MNRKPIISLFILSILLAGCSYNDIFRVDYAEESATEIIQQATENEESTLSTSEDSTQIQTPSLIIQKTIIPGDGLSSLTIEEYPMTDHDSVESVLSDYQDAPWNTYSYRDQEVWIDEDLYSYMVDYIPIEENNEDGPLYQAVITILKNSEPELTIQARDGGPVDVVWGFHVYGESWFLEINQGGMVREDKDGIVSITTIINGDIIQDGVSLNEREGYQESFGFTLISGKPFYFFERDGLYGYYFNGIENPLGYTEIDHFRCCSGAMANPRMSEDTMAFFASKGEQRFFVLIGTDKQGNN